MVCLVTGSSRGLGRAVAIAFGREGHRVVVHYRERAAEAEETASLIRESMVLSADVRDSGEVAALVDEVIKKWGGIDVLVNNAGITKEALLIRTTERDFDEVMDTNLRGAFNLIRAVAPRMIERKSGHIINISSIAGIRGREGLAAYSASKAALAGLTLAAARELGAYNIMVNTVLPGYMLTGMGTGAGEKARQAALRDSIVKDFSDPDRVARFICYLCGTTGITGQVFNLDSRTV
ncbi:MAG: SDR family NAD(P)-dependent oxidoreductase [Deferribacteres bacterium]|nr:SDR family NAD(P)-dependent oxidoreductase [Deferribacteres bacterium]